MALQIIIILFFAGPFLSSKFWDKIFVSLNPVNNHEMKLGLCTTFSPLGALLIWITFGISSWIFENVAAK